MRVCCRKRAPAQTPSFYVSTEKESPRDAQLVIALKRCLECDPETPRLEHLIAALLRSGTNPCRAFTAGPCTFTITSLSALHLACMSSQTDSRHLHALLLSVAPIDWQRMADVPVVPRAAATPLGACWARGAQTPHADSSEAALRLFRSVGEFFTQEALPTDGSAGAAAAASTPSVVSDTLAALITAGARALMSIPCWLSYRDTCDIRLPLHVAAAAWDVASVEILLRAGAAVDAPSTAHFTALELALRIDGPPAANESDRTATRRTVFALLRAGAMPQRSIRRLDALGRALDLAVCAADAEIFRALLAAGADPTPLPFAELSDGEVSSTHYLTVAVQRGLCTVVEAALDAGVSVETRSCDALKRAPLHIAVACSNAEMVELLLARGADPNVKWEALILQPRPHFRTPLDLAERVSAEADVAERIKAALICAGGLTSEALRLRDTDTTEALPPNPALVVAVIAAATLALAAEEAVASLASESIAPVDADSGGVEALTDPLHVVRNSMGEQAPAATASCSFCSHFFGGKDGEPLVGLSCARCRQAMYCGTACQTAHWTDHKVVCRAFATAHPA